MFAKHLDIDHSLVDVTELNRAKQTFDPVDDFESPAVTERQDQSQADDFPPFARLSYEVVPGRPSGKSVNRPIA